MPAVSGTSGTAGTSASRLGGHGGGATPRSGLSTSGGAQLASTDKLRLSRIRVRMGRLVEDVGDCGGGLAGYGHAGGTGPFRCAGVDHCRAEVLAPGGLQGGAVGLFGEEG